MTPSSSRSSVILTVHHPPGNTDPDFSNMYQELGRKGMTLQLLWEDYIGANPKGLRYSQFCQRYRQWCGHLDISMRQQHRLGEELFVDYAGPTVSVVDIQAGTTRQAQLFVAVLGASRYTYLEATFSQNEADWQASHLRCFEHLGGVPEVVVPDNLKSAVTTPNRYEPLIQESYAEFARIPLKPITHSDRRRSLIPLEADHQIQTLPFTDSA